MNASRLVPAALVFIAGSVCAAALLAFPFHGLSAGTAAAAYAVALALAIAAFSACPGTAVEKPRSWDWLAITLFALVSARAFLWLAVMTSENLVVLSPNNLGDLTKHWNYIRYLAAGCEFWPDNPLIAGSSIRYPFGMDLFNAQLVVLGYGIVPGLIATGVVGAAMAGHALFRWGRGFAIAGFLCNGGLAAWEFFSTCELRDYQAEFAWKNLFLAIFVTQRGFLYSLPAGLLLLESWRARWRSERPTLPLPIEVMLYAVMPLFHIHTFIFLSGLLGWWICFGSRDLRRHSLRVVLPALIPAGALTLLVTDGFAGPGFVRTQPGWMQGDAPLLSFWLGNFGLFLPLCAAFCIWLLVKRTDRVAAAFVLPAGAFFLLCCFVALAPWDWDNTKLMLWSYLAVLPFLGDYFIARRPLWIAMPVLVLLFFSGFISLLGGLKDPGHALASRKEHDSLALPLRSLSIEARFAAAPDFDHPLLLHGRKVAMAYPGYLFGHGLPYAEAEANLEKLMRGMAGWEEATRALDVEYLFWGRHEEAEYADSTKPWIENAAVVAEGYWGAIYELPGARDSIPAPAGATSDGPYQP
jgi:hypothetical protein